MKLHLGVGALLLATMLSASSAAPDRRGREIPFPVRTTILREEKVTYVVEGRVKIPVGVEITCLRDVYIVGKGSDAVIEVEGRLKVHGVGSREVIFENVAVELKPKFESVHMDMAIFRKGSALRTTPDHPSTGKRFFLELVDFKGDASLDLTVKDVPITLSSVCSDRPVHIRAVTPDGARENKVKLIVRGCTQGTGHPGLIGGLIVEDVYDACIRINVLGGALSAFRRCRTLIFDGNKVTSKKLEFEVTADSDFRKTKVMKCDIYSQKVTAVSPVNPDKTRDQIFMDRCWFRGIKDPKKVREQVLQDGEGDDQNAVRILLNKVGKRPLELAGAWIR
jgi:hypothetical protein